MSRLRNPSPRAIALIAVLGGLLVAVVVFVKVMSDSDYRRTGTNSFVPPTHAEVPPGKSLCQSNEFVPKGSGVVAPWAGGPVGADGGPVAVTVYSADQVVARGRSLPRFKTGITLMHLDRTIDRDIYGARICFTNHDRVAMFMYGDYAPAGNPGAQAPILFGGRPALMRIDWYRPKPNSWWRTVSAISDRFPLLKAGFFGAWTFWLTMAAVLLLSGAAIWRILREARA